VRGWVDDYPVEEKRCLPLCREYGKQLEQKEVVLFDDEATEAAPPDHCGVCEEQMDDLRDAVILVLVIASLTFLQAYPVMAQRTFQVAEGITAMQLRANCQFQYYTPPAQHVNTLVLNCPGMCMMRLWPLPVQQSWFEDWWESIEVDVTF